MLYHTAFSDKMSNGLSLNYGIQVSMITVIASYGDELARESHPLPLKTELL